MSPKATMTADELFSLSLPDKCAELIKGVLVVREPPGYMHGSVAGELAFRLTAFAKQEQLGRVLAAETGFKLESDPDTVRAPDVAFIRSERLPSPPPDAYAELAPDLVVEVLSPRDRPGAVLSKVGDWLDAGSLLVWVVDPQRRVTRVFRADGSESLIEVDGILDGEEVVPGFSCPLAEIF